MKRVSCILCILLILSVQVCLAKSDEWKSSNYDFQQIKTVLVLQPNIQQSVDNPFALQKTADFLADNLNSKNVRWVNLKYVVDQVGKETNTNMDELFQNNPKQFSQILQEAGPHYVDAVLRIDVFSYGWSTQFVEGYYSPQIDTGMGSFNGNFGNTHFNGSYSAPVTTYQYVPGANEQIANAGCIFTLYDAKTLNIIWGYTDNRSKNTRAVGFAHPNAPINKMFKSHASHDDLMKKVISASLDKAPFVSKH